MEEVVSKLPTEFEYVFVNDGSQDKTLALMKELASLNSHVRYISFLVISERSSYICWS